jgi:glyoxylase-like metal-dependent hydrolase (beta-lactamase superfamily II)
LADGNEPGKPRWRQHLRRLRAGRQLHRLEQTLERTLALDFDIVIPGHGPVSSKADLITFKADLEAMRARRALVQQGTKQGSNW